MNRGILFLIIFGVIAAFIANDIITSDPFGYDESDYVYAARKGFASNYVDEGAIPIQSFIEQGSDLGTDKSKRSNLSEFIRSQDDITFYRHYHGPLYFYWIASGIALADDAEAPIRWTSWCLVLVSIIILYIGYNRVYAPSTGWGGIFMLAMVAAGTSYIYTVTQVTPHGMYAIIAVLFLFTFSQFISFPSTKRLYLSAAALALAFLSIEYAALLLVTGISLLWVHRKNITGSLKMSIWQVLLRLATAWLLTITVLWIGGVIKLTLIKNYVFFTYFTIVRGSEFGTGSFIDVWANRFIESPVEYTLIIVALVYAVLRYRKNITYQPILLYTFLVLATSLRNTSISPTYISSFMVVASIAVAWLIDAVQTRLRPVIFIPGVVCLLLALGATYYLHHSTRKPDSNAPLLRSLLQYPSTQPAHAAAIPRILLPPMHLYYPRYTFVSYDEKFDHPDSVAAKCQAHNVRSFLYYGADSTKFMTAMRSKFGVAVQNGVNNKTNVAFVALLAAKP